MADTIARILNTLPSRNGHAPVNNRVMTTRMPTALHKALKAEALTRDISLNQLAIAKLSIRSEILDRCVELEEAEIAAGREATVGS